MPATPSGPDRRRGWRGRRVLVVARRTGIRGPSGRRLAAAGGGGAGAKREIVDAALVAVGRRRAAPAAGRWLGRRGAGHGTALPSDVGGGSLDGAARSIPRPRRGRHDRGGGDLAL